MTTERLEQSDAYLQSCEAKVLQVVVAPHGTSVVLDRSVFYPESGGQLGDQGKLNFADGDLEVTDTQIDDRGQVHHQILQAPQWLRVGLSCQATIAWQRRRDQMSQHTGQHMLSAAAFSMFGLETVSARLGSQVSTIDLDSDQMEPQQVDDWQSNLNQQVMTHRNIRVLQPNDNELKQLSLRRPPKVKQGIRLVEIEGLDLTPCGGTHCRTTGEVGPIAITQCQRLKGNLRVSFLAGERTIRYFQERCEWVDQSAQLLACAPPEMVSAIDRQLAESTRLQRELGSWRAKALEAELEHLVTELVDQQVVVLLRPDLDPNDGRRLVERISQRLQATVVLVCGSQPSRFIAHSDSANLGDWLKESGSALQMRGGGRAQHVEGVIGVAQVDQAWAERLKAQLRAWIQRA